MKDEPAWLNERFHSRMAATNSEAVATVGRSESWPYSSSSERPDQKVSSKESMALRVLRNSSVLLTMIDQHQTEASSRPSITSCTTMDACMTIDQTDTSAGAAAVAAVSATVCAKADENIENPCAAGREMRDGTMAVPCRGNRPFLRLRAGVFLAAGIKAAVRLRER